MKPSHPNGQTNIVKENNMVARRNAGITGPGGTNVDPFYNRPPVKLPTKVDLQNMPIKTWGAGDPDYIKKMIASGKSKPVKRK